MRNRTLLKLLAAGMFIAFAFAGLWLLFLGFEIGDVYPPFSSHRSELDGTQVLYEALERLPEVSVGRHYGPANRIERAVETTVLVAGLSALDWYLGDEKEMTRLLRLADDGARLVVCLDSAAPLVSLLEATSRERKQKKEEKPKQPAGEKIFDVVLRAEEKQAAETVSDASTGRTVVRPAQLILQDEQDPLPARLPASGSVSLDPKGKAWKTVYARQGRPAVIRRTQGTGEVVLLADSYLITNRAMWEARYPQFLTWLVGARRRVLFYERHLGVAEDPGVASLLRKYQLHGVLAALVIVMLLFVWRNSVPLLPAPRSAADTRPLEIRDRGSSLTALVARTLAPSELLDVCLGEWKKSEKPGAQLVDQAERLAHERRDVVEAYRQIVAIVRKGVRS
ncbi:MAG: DUF4350 domain-containing protein [Acidobacteria bacterium]|nr:MAG: DUF4350 domain-containing protein [Acidobacteriota bacterium]